MRAREFEKPISVFVGLGFPKVLYTVFDAYKFLSEWNGNSPEQRAALKACRAAIGGDIDPETARGVVIEFAKRKDILAPEPPPMSIFGQDHSRHA